MTELDLESVRRVLQEDPADPRGLMDLAVWVQRHGRAPDFLDPAWLPHLVTLWGTRPEDRTPLGLFTALTGLEPVDDRERALPAWWRTKTRDRASEAGLFDALTGLPLRVRRSSDDAVMVLVPGGPTLLGPPLRQLEGARRLAVAGVACHAHVDAFYVDEVAVPASALQAFADEGWTTRPGDWWGTSYLPLSLAEAYLEAVGARLPTEAEIERAARGADGRRFPWGNEVSALDQYWLDGEELAHLLAEIHPDIQHPLADRVPGELDEVRAGGRPSAVRRLLEELTDTTPFGLRGARGGGDLWCADVWVRDPWAAAEDRNPRRDQVTEEDDRYELVTRRRALEEEMGEFDNRHEDAPAATRERIRRQSYSPYTEEQLDEVVERRRRGVRRVARSLGRCERYSYVRTCLQRSAMQAQANGYDLALRGVRGLSGPPEAFSPRGEAPARRVEVPVALDMDQPRDEERTVRALAELRELLTAPGGRRT